MADQSFNEKIQQRNNMLMETFKRGDIDAVSNLYTKNGEFLAPNAKPFKGKEQIKSFMQATMDAGVKELKLETRELEQHGETAIEIGNAKLYGENGQLLDDAKFIVIWKKEDGEWKLHRDMFNSNMPVQ